MSEKVLIAYASAGGSTAEVAKAIGEVMQDEDVIADILSVRDIEDVSDYRAIIVGSSIRFGRWLGEALQFLETHQAALSQKPVAYFTTCLTMAEDSEDSRRKVLAYMEPVLQKAPQIKPVGLGLFAGSLDPNRLLLPMARASLFPQGDYRDWEAIRAWAKEIRPILLAGDIAPDEPLVLREAILSYTDLSGSDLHEADLNQANLHRADLHQADLHQTNLHGANLQEADLHQADLHQADLHAASLNWADMNWADMSQANLAGANLIGADLNKANLDRANLSRAVLNGANLNQANLSGADLSFADLNWADLRGADLRNANLSNANLGWANLSEADLNGANLNQARYNFSTEWPENFSAQACGAILVGGGLH